MPKKTKGKPQKRHGKPRETKGKPQPKGSQRRTAKSDLRFALAGGGCPGSLRPARGQSAQRERPQRTLADVAGRERPPDNFLSGSKRIDLLTFWFSHCGPYLVMAPKGQPFSSRSFGELSFHLVDRQIGFSGSPKGPNQRKLISDLGCSISKRVHMAVIMLAVSGPDQSQKLGWIPVNLPLNGGDFDGTGLFLGRLNICNRLWTYDLPCTPFWGPTR